MKLDIKSVKIFVTVPCEYVEAVRNAVWKIGAGIIGDYTFCSYSVQGIGTFKPNNDATPYIGAKNKLEIVKEEKLEFVCDLILARKVVTEIRKVHPYEEPAIDIVPLIDEQDLI